MASRRPEELCPGGDRASVVAKKRGNARGVKGGRKVETLNERMKGNDTVNVQWTQFGEEQKQVRKTFDPSPESIGCPGNGRQRLNEPESSGDASADLLESNHQLESRIQEIWPSGSEGGAKLTLSLPLSQPRVSTLGTGEIVNRPEADFFRRVLICLRHNTNPVGRYSTAKKSLIKYGGVPPLI
jgi:hypothetical protein